MERLDGNTLKSDEIFVADSFVPGTRAPLSRFILEAVSSDGQRLAGGLWLGDGTQADAPSGILVLDVKSQSVRLIAEDRDFANLHLQYCRSCETEASHDLMLQMNHGYHSDTAGKAICHLGPSSEGGCDIHVVRDDGSNWRDLPWGRDGRESCIGHQI